MEVSGHLQDQAALPPGKKPLVLIGKEAEWAPESGHSGKEENPCHYWEPNPILPSP